MARRIRATAAARVARACAGPLALLGGLAAPAAASELDSLRLAYVDPGAGSFVLQALVAAIAGAVVAANAYWSRLRAFLGLPAAKSEDEKPTSLPPDDD